MPFVAGYIVFNEILLPEECLLWVQIDVQECCYIFIFNSIS